MPGSGVRAPIAEAIRANHPGWMPDDRVCTTCLHTLRADYVAQVLETERGELSNLEEEVLKSIREQDLIAQDLNREFDRQLTFGERLSDQVAEFGGSWKFIIFFGVAMGIWITINSIALMAKPIDPFPYILLNLMLSCLAALQAPIIMMSQNRQEAKDRLRAEHDYRINLKAELEIRNLHAKIDQLMTHQWQRLLEIQQIQIESMEELARLRGGAQNE